ncbi:hypothetical protein [Aeromicrobium sp.]|uniref:hypothetical protein n=1 Tax=Aeromicrobium sp. TaxID=1871063 RepID=UPI0025BB945C|nr:hypothetical protein [Aeromicrobium sp.]MCK5890435.1 hypothetical protein [Aeromicrobium sp.]
MTSSRRLPAGALVPAIVTSLLAALLVVLVPQPAQAAACTAGSGVTVVVQGGPVNSTTCLNVSSTTALSALRSVYSVTPAGGNGQGAICRIDNYPGPDQESCMSMPPASAYWSIHHSRGGTGSWSYSNSGAGSLTLRSGDWVGFRFGSGGAPSVTPRGPAAPSPAPTQPPASGGSGGSGSGNGPGSTGGAGGSAPAPSADPTVAPGETPGATPDAEPSADASAGPSSAATAAEERDDKTRATSSSVDEQDGSGPWGLVVAVLLVAGVVAAAIVVNRRRQSGA